MKNSKERRYEGGAKHKSAFMTRFLVVCPNCQKDAEVSVDNPWRLNNGQLKCKNCFYSEAANDLVCYHVSIKRNCDHCGQLIKVTVPNQKNKKSTLRIPCPHCETVRIYQPKNQEDRLIYQSSSNSNDPVFNLPLWLQTSVKGHLFWAYNYQHLNEIKTYVISELRERQSNYYMTMVERLPQFIKSAKNRNAILKIIEKLEKGQQEKIKVKNFKQSLFYHAS